MEASLQGLYVPLITPFTEEGDLAADALEKLAHAVIEQFRSTLDPYNSEPTGDITTVTSRPARSFTDWAQTHRTELLTPESTRFAKPSIEDYAARTEQTVTAWTSAQGSAASGAPP